MIRIALGFDIDSGKMFLQLGAIENDNVHNMSAFMLDDLPSLLEVKPFAAGILKDEHTQLLIDFLREHNLKPSSIPIAVVSNSPNTVLPTLKTELSIGSPHYYTEQPS